APLSALVVTIIEYLRHQHYDQYHETPSFGKDAPVWYDTAMLWTISDLHLSSVNPKPMDIFGDRWKNHPQRIAAAWRARVHEHDTVLVAGDISWAMKLDEALPDLRWIAELPGR